MNLKEEFETPEWVEILKELIKKSKRKIRNV